MNEESEKEASLVPSKKKLVKKKKSRKKRKSKKRKVIEVKEEEESPPPLPPILKREETISISPGLRAILPREPIRLSNSKTKDIRLSGKKKTTQKKSNGLKFR